MRWLPVDSKLLKRLLLALGFVAMGTNAEMAQAIDLLPYQPADSQTSSSATSARLLNSGSYDMGLAVRGSSGTINQSALKENSSDEDILKRGGSATAIFGAGLTDWLQLNVAIKSTNEEMKNEDRYGLIESNEVGSELENPQSTAFGGATVMAKVGVVTKGAFRLALAPFVESGVGSAGTLALTRSDAPTAGWQVLGSYGKPGLAEFDLSAGYRYRDAAIVGDYQLRNELFYQGAAKGYVNNYFALFLAGQGRMITASSQKQFIETDRREHSSLESGEASAGTTFRFGSSELSLYGGRRIQQYAIGNGRDFAGLSMRYVFAKKRRSLADGINHDKTPNIYKEDARPNEWKPSDQEIADSSAKSKSNKEAMAADEAKPLPAALHPSLNLFDDVERVIAEERDNSDDPGDFGALPQDKDAVPKEDGMADEDRVEGELKKLRAAEDQQKLEDDKKQKIKDELDRQGRLKRYEKSQALENQYREELREKVESLPEVTEEDYGWSGLEDNDAD